MSQNETHSTPPLADICGLNSIQPSEWVNIPKCITDAFQLLVSQVQATQTQVVTINQTVSKSHEQLETQFKSFAQAQGLSEKEIAKLIDGFRDTLNRTLKNFSLEVSVISETAIDSQQKIQQLQELTKNLKKGFGGLEDNAFQEIIKDITEELALKFDVKEANLKDYVSNRIHEVIDIPGLIGTGKKFSNLKSLIRHLHDNYDSRADAISEIVDKRDAFFKKAVADYDLPTKIKTIVHSEIRQHVMPEIEKMDMIVRKEQDTKRSSSDVDLIARIQSLEETSKSLEAKIMRLQVYHDAISSPRDSKGMERFEENKETIGSKDSIVDIEIRTRSKSDSREMGRGFRSQNEVGEKNKLSRNLLWKDTSEQNLIQEEDEDILSPQQKGRGANNFLEGCVEAGDDKNKDVASHQLVSDLVKEKNVSAQDSMNVSMNSVNMAQSSTSSQQGRSPIRAIKPAVGGTRGKPKRSATISLASRNAKPNLKTTTEESFSIEKEGDISHHKHSPHRANILDNSNVTDRSGHHFSKPQIFDLSEFNLKQMEPHTFEFLSVLEQEFDAIYNSISELFHQSDMNKHKHTHNDLIVQQRQQAQARIGAGLPVKASPPKNSKVTAYQMLKALTRREEEVPVKDEGPSQQEIRSRPPLVQIGPQGIKMSTIPSPGPSHLPHLPQRARLGSEQLMNEGDGHGHGQGNANMRMTGMSPLKMRTTQGNGKPWTNGFVPYHQATAGKDGRHTDLSFDAIMSGKGGVDDKEDSVFVPEGNMPEISIARPRALTQKEVPDRVNV